MKNKEKQVEVFEVKKPQKEIELTPVSMDTQEQMMKTSSYLIKKGLVPRSFKEPSQVYLALHSCQALGFSTFGSAVNALKEMYVFDGQIHIFGSLPLALVQKSGLLEDMEEFFIDDEGKKICYENKNLGNTPGGAVCRLKRKGMMWNEYHITSKDLIKEGGKRSQDGSWIFTKGKDRKESYTWKAYPKSHLRYRARAIGLKSLFSDALKNMAIGGGLTSNEGSAKVPEESQISKTYEKKDLNEGNIAVKLEPPTLTKEAK